MERTPSLNVDFGRVTNAGDHWVDIDAAREAHRYFWNERGKFWVLTRAEDIREAGHDPETFCNQSIIPTEPNPDYRFIPSHMDPPEHLKYRHVMNAWFAPQNVKRLSPRIHEIATEIAESIAPTGACDWITTFGDRFPIRGLMLSLGLEEHFDQGAYLVDRVRRRARLRAAEDYAGAMTAWNEMEVFWQGLLDDRRRAPRDPKTDYITHLLESRVDGAPISDADMINICVTLTIGGVDTTRAQLAWGVYHFATHPEDRERVLDDPSLLPNALEEFMRYYAILGMGRKVTRDVDFHGCPMKKDDMLFLWYASASRDPRTFPDADKVIIDREPNRHVAFGSSLHRCLGSHLAREEMEAGMRAWLNAVPHFRIASDEPLKAIGGQIALTELPLVWDVA